MDRPDDIRALVAGQATPDLFRLYDAVLEELAHRGVVRSTNNPIADYAEWLVARAFGLMLAGRSATGYDATGPDGLRYQVKARRPTVANPSRQLSFFHGLDKDPFNILVAVLFTPDHEVLRAAWVPVHVVRQEARFVEHVNAWRLVLRDRVWDIPGVIDVTREIRAAAETVGERETVPPAHIDATERVADQPPSTDSAMKTCRSCGRTFPATRAYFYKWSRAGQPVDDGWYPVHKACYQEARAARRQARDQAS